MVLKFDVGNMLINKMGTEEAGESSPIREDDTHEYQTASELFELMTRSHGFRSSEDLSKRDLILLYKNIDLGTKLLPNNNDLVRVKQPNQRVETIVHADDLESDGSEIGDIYSTEDMLNVIELNNEQIDLLNNQSSIENTLCHKLGDLGIQNSQLNKEYDKYILFQDSYLNKSNLMPCTNDLQNPVLPVPLLDYICCKRLEDNYNFDMETIIRYVKHTIEHLKRISNGDYLTDKAKEMWREVENIHNDQNTKVLATSTSIPLHVQGKITGLVSSWDDIVRSEVDVRSLSKILEKKIIIEIPKLIRGTYNLFSERRADNLIISCRKEKSKMIAHNSEPGVDVVLQLQRSESGHVMSNISSIMVLQAAPDTQRESCTSKPLPLSYVESECKKKLFPEKKVHIVELDSSIDHSKSITKKKISSDSENEVLLEKDDGDESRNESYSASYEYTCSENEGNSSSKSHHYQESSDSSDALRDIVERKVIPITKTTNIVNPEEFKLSMQKLNLQKSLPEESGEDLSPLVDKLAPKKRRSPTRVRIKSPYENRSHILEERKRKKLLEIREKREQRKLALRANYKANKYAYDNAAMPQSSNSVTKLSITNKSFYNSIYGHKVPTETKLLKGKTKIIKKEIIPEISLEDLEGEHEKILETPDKASKKYVDKSYYLDETETEMMYLKRKQSNADEGLKDIGSASTSAGSNDFKTNLSLLSQLMVPSESDFDSNEIEKIISSKNSPDNEEVNDNDKTKVNESPLDLVVIQSKVNMVPLNTPRDTVSNKIQLKKTSSAVECRESIDQIYDLMKNIEQNQLRDSKSTRHENINFNSDEVRIAGHNSSTVQASDSGTSLKHYLTSGPSCFSFEKANIEDTQKKSVGKNKSEVPTAAVPKVVINTKPHLSSPNKGKKDKHNFNHPTSKIIENPLKAISQLLREFEDVQKKRQKNTESTPSKKEEAFSFDNKNNVSQNLALRSSRVDHNKHIDSSMERKKFAPRQRNINQPLMEVSKQHPAIIEEKHERTFRKRVIDIIDQEKEARGEAVRGPSKFPSRINTLAQPKRSYVQAHSEEYQTKYGRNILADRLQRLAAKPLPVAQRPTGSACSRNRIKRPETLSLISGKHLPPAPPLERVPKARILANTPTCKAVTNSASVPYKLNIPNAPETLERMVAVESYVNSHYGPAESVDGSPCHVHKSRVPLLPNDIYLVSASETSNNSPEESCRLGNKLHHIINSMIKPIPSGLAVLSEGCEDNSKFTSDKSQDLLEDSLSKDDENVSTSSDYQIDIFQDKNVETAVVDVPETVKTKTEEESLVIEVAEAIEENQCEMQSFTPSTVLMKLENALYQKLSLGAFQNRLRIKNLTLTPKPSINQVIALESGDAESLIVNASNSRNVIINKGTSFCDIKSLPVLSKTRLDWNFAEFPMRITTVAYAFPKHHKSQGTSSSGIICMDNTHSSKQQDICFSLNRSKSDEISTHKKGRAPSIFKEQSSITINSPDIRVDVKENNNTKNKDVSVVKVDDKIESKDVEISMETFKSQSTQPKRHNNDVKDSATDAMTSGNLDDVDYTTSLDMLVGLLNEIKKITSCQSQIANPDSKDRQCENLETVINENVGVKTSANDSSHDVKSITSSNKIKELESSTEIYTYYISKNNTERNMSSTNTLKDSIPLTVDKQVSVDILDREQVNNFTDVPSQLIPVTLNHSTNVTNSLIGLFSEPSNQSLFSLAEYNSYAMSSFERSKKIINLSEVQTSNESHRSLVPYIDVAKDERIRKSSCIEIFTPVSVSKNVDALKCKGTNLENKVNNFSGHEDFDPILKMKRDILVTVYSILVFTVFAALSFPEIMNNI